MVYLILAVIFYSISLLIGASASRNANTNLVAFINTLFSIFIPLAIIIPSASKKFFTTQKYGLIMAAVSGVIVSLFVLSLTKSFTENKVGIVTPVIYGGTIVITTLASYFLFKERVSLTEGIGLLLVIVGLGVIIYARAVAG